MQFDLIQEKLKFHYPRGRLVSSLLPTSKSSELLFEAEELFWDKSNNTFTLMRDIRLKDAALGTIDTDKTLTIVQKKEGEQTYVSAIRTTGKTHLQYHGPTPESVHHLLCFGPMTFNRDQLAATLRSPSKGGKTAEEEQIFYQQGNSASFADSGIIDYAIVDEKLTPVLLHFKGNIRLFSQGENAPKRCSLADRLSYSPDTRTLILSADPGKRVLFWDEEQAIRMAAQEVHIVEDPETKKESIQAVGNVKFAFTSQESALLQQIFPFYKREAPHHE